MKLQLRKYPPSPTIEVSMSVKILVTVGVSITNIKKQQYKSEVEQRIIPNAVCNDDIYWYWVTENFMNDTPQE